MKRENLSLEQIFLKLTTSERAGTEETAVPMEQHVQNMDTEDTQPQASSDSTSDSEEGSK